MASAHERAEFRNAATYTVAVTITVRGGKRPGTAERRARQVAERLANTAARAAGVVEATATAGLTIDGQVPRADRVAFGAANSGHPTAAQPGKLDRYLHPDRDAALRSLAAANGAFRARLDADLARRQAVGCANPNLPLAGYQSGCGCVYCTPVEHIAAAGDPHGPDGPDGPDGVDEFAVHRCPCGQAVTRPGERCLGHRDATVVALPGDPPLLQRIAAAAQPDPSVEACSHGCAPPVQDVDL